MAKPGKQLNLTAVPAPNDAAAAQYYPAIYWYSMLKIPGQRSVRRQERHPVPNVKQSDWLNLMKNNGCVGCHQLGQLGDPHHSRSVRRLQDRRGRLDPAHPVRPGGRTDGQYRWPASSAARRTNISASGPIGSPRANCRTPSRRGRRASSAMSSSPPGTGPTRSTISTISRRQTSAIRRSMATARCSGSRNMHRPHPDPRSGHEQRRRLHAPVRDAEHAEIARTRPCRDAQAAGALRLLG